MDNKTKACICGYPMEQHSSVKVNRRSSAWSTLSNLFLLYIFIPHIKEVIFKDIVYKFYAGGLKLYDLRDIRDG